MLPDTITGLTSAEAEEKLKKFGPNTVQTQHTSIFRILLDQFLSPLIYLLILAAVISFVTDDATDGIIIAIIIAVNATIGFIQEVKALKTSEKLQGFITSKTSVLRDGEMKQIDKSLVVPDDVVFYKLGDIVSADAYVLQENDLLVDESSLTGESVQVTKRVNADCRYDFHDGIIYSGSLITKGTVAGQVFATGKFSNFGKITDLAVNTRKRSEYETNLNNLSKGFMVVAIVALIVIFAAHILLHKQETMTQILLFTVAIAITIIPEALPIVATLTLSKQSLALSKRGVIIKHSSSIEDLGNLDIVCTDKTGTLTKNELKIQETLAQDEQELNAYAYLSAYDSPDPFDVCLAAFTASTKPEADPGEYKEIPFNPEQKYSGRKFKTFTILKGAPEFILEHAQVEDREELLNKISQSCLKGFRALSLALEKGRTVTYLGTYLLIDEVKDDVKDVIDQARKLNINLKVITGDSLPVGIYVGKQVGLIDSDEQAVDAKDLHFDDEDELFKEVLKFTIFARADPIQKYKIIQSLQREHHVGYLGDGINDAPSLKLANVGMVVDTATDVAKSTADIILLTKNLGVIVEGIVDGRKAFENIDKYVKHTLTGNFGNFITIGLVSLFINYLPILPIQILISNLLTDIPSLGYSLDRVDRQEVRKPKNHDTTRLLEFALSLGIVSSIFDLLFFLWARGEQTAITQTQWFIFSTLTELLVLFSIRSHKPLWKARPPAMALMIMAAFSSIFVIVSGLVGIPGLRIESVGFRNMGIIVGIAVCYLAVTELVKIWFVRSHQEN